MKALRNLQKQTQGDNEDKAPKRPGRPFSDVKSVHVGLRLTSKTKKFVQVKSPLGDKNILSVKLNTSTTFKQLLDELIETFFPDDVNPVIGHRGKYVFDIVNTLNESIDATDFTIQNYTSKKHVAGQLRLHLLCSMATSNSQCMMNTQPEPQGSASFAANPAAQSMMNIRPEPQGSATASFVANPAAQQRMMNTQPEPQGSATFAANPAAQHRMMNTQPEPQGSASFVANYPAAHSMMNTQPEPQGSASFVANPAAQSMMNTQPEPQGSASFVANPAAQQHMMNTQPEPQGSAGVVAYNSNTISGDVILASSDESIQFIDLTVSGEVAARLSSTPQHADEHVSFLIVITPCI